MVRENSRLFDDRDEGRGPVAALDITVDCLDAECRIRTGLC
jgi:hypothetical protein